MLIVPPPVAVSVPVFAIEVVPPLRMIVPPFAVIVPPFETESWPPLPR